MTLAAVGDTFESVAAGGPLLLALAVCVLAGLVSFASPCVVPLVPGYLSYLAGLVGSEAPPISPAEAVAKTVRTGRGRVVAAAALFVAGFTIVFVLATVTVFGVVGTLLVNREALQRIGGVITIVLGLVFVGLIPMLQRDLRFEPRKVTTILGAPLLGAVFALGWTPCLGPTLGGVMTVAAGTEGATAVRGAALVTAYCLGLGLPFVVLAFGSASALRGVGWIRRHARAIQVTGGIFMIGVGIALLTGLWDQFVAWIRDAFVSDTTLPI